MLIALAILIATLRIMGITAAWYQAVAHMFLGYLIGAWWFGPKERHELYPGTTLVVDLNALLFIGLTIVEVACFLVFRFAT